MALGFVYLWALMDKMFGLGGATPADDPVLAAAWPRVGYLSSTEGRSPSSSTPSPATSSLTSLFLVGLGAVGINLVAGVFLGLVAIGGTLLIGGINLSALPLTNYPLVDEHLIYVVLGWLLASLNAGLYFGLGKRWQSLPVVRGSR